MKASLAVALTVGAAHTASATNASVRVYTNTNLDDNHRFFGQFAPGVIDSVYWCCIQYQFTDKGAFGGLRRSEDLQANLDAFRGVFKQNWVVGTVDEAFIKSAAAFDSDFMKEQFASAAAAAQQHGIDGYLVDFEPKDDYSEAMSHNYMLFLKAFKSAMPANVGVGMNVAGWGILNRFEEYAAANLTVYTSMSNTYFGNHPSRSIASLKEEVAALPKEAIRVGIGSELTSYTSGTQGDYKWTAPALTEVLNALWDLDIPRVDVWRADIDVAHLNITAFMIDGLTAFKNGKQYGAFLPWPPIEQANAH
eukprot:TRINITY_DN555_c4_g1_i2.p1 TRINITY_DN555_c4_g1~~TRINITY_DN555_c4_g1_i2.p1  ORF type:complete len:307 (+),score=106.99 TRINITY_DN555_c4_g1_i2:53-973(+)